jgi:hypothetical protein
MGKTFSGGIELGTGFKLLDPSPIVDYMVVDFIADLAELPNQFVGMETFVKESETEWVKTSAGWKETGKTTIKIISADTQLVEADKHSMIIVTANVLITTPAVFSPSWITDIDAMSAFRLQTAGGTTATGNIDGAVMPYNVPKNGQISIFANPHNGLTNTLRIKGDIL